MRIMKAPPRSSYKCRRCARRGGGLGDGGRATKLYEEAIRAIAQLHITVVHARTLVLR